MATILNSEIITYNPAAWLTPSTTLSRLKPQKKAFRIRGIYLPGKGVAYNGLYYDSLKTSLLMPVSLRHDLTPEQTIGSTGYLTQKVQASVRKVELHVNLIELLPQQQSKNTEEQIICVLFEHEAIAGVAYNLLSAISKRLTLMRLIAVSATWSVFWP